MNYAPSRAIEWLVGTCEDNSMSQLRKLHELHEKHENLWWILLAVIAAVGLLLFSSSVLGLV